MNWNNSPAVMPALVAGIHVFAAFQRSNAWMAGKVVKQIAPGRDAKAAKTRMILTEIVHRL
jgi:hypothetical protein